MQQEKILHRICKKFFWCLTPAQSIHWVQETVDLEDLNFWALNPSFVTSPGEKVDLELPFSLLYHDIIGHFNVRASIKNCFTDLWIF